MIDCSDQAVWELLWELLVVVYLRVAYLRVAVASTMLFLRRQRALLVRDGALIVHPTHPGTIVDS